MVRGLFVIFPNERAPPTHPDCAALVDPLFACGGKRVKKFENIFIFQDAFCNGTM
jgi:hypothetical protein